MRRKLASLAVLLTIVGVSVTAQAQYPVGGGLGMFFDGDLGTPNALEFSTTQTFTPGFTQQTVYAVATALTEIAAYEFDVLMPEGVQVSGSTVFPPGEALDFADGNLAFRAGTGGCVDASASMFPTATYGGFFWPLASVNFFVTAEITDGSICLTGRTQDIPFFTICDAAGTKFLLLPATSGGETYADGCAVINPTAEPPVSSEQRSFGSIKARY
jgi:hypothetical protein